MGILNTNVGTLAAYLLVAREQNTAAHDRAKYILNRPEDITGRQIVDMVEDLVGKQVEDVRYEDMSFIEQTAPASQEH